MRNSITKANGKVHIRTSFRSTLVTVTNMDGEAIAWGQSAKDVTQAALSHGITTVEVVVKGPGKGREEVIRTLQDAGIEIVMIKDVTPIPHNGCRPARQKSL